MRKPQAIFLLIILVSILYQTSFSQDGFPYHLYEPRTLSEFEAIHGAVKTLDDSDAPSIMISAKPFYSSIRVQYVGISRKISKERLFLIKIWQESLNINANALERLDQEYLFKECETEYWIPVQKQVAAYFPKELKEGDLITIFTMAVGGVKDKNNWNFIFLTNEFQKY